MGYYVCEEEDNNMNSQSGVHTQSARTYGMMLSGGTVAKMQRWRAKTGIAILFYCQECQYDHLIYNSSAHTHMLLSSNIDTSFVKRKCSAFFAIGLRLVNFNQLTFYREYNDNFAPAHAQHLRYNWRFDFLKSATGRLPPG